MTALAQPIEAVSITPLHVEAARIVAILPPARLQAWLTCGERIVGGMPITQAERLMWAEIAAAEVSS